MTLPRLSILVVMMALEVVLPLSCAEWTVALTQVVPVHSLHLPLLMVPILFMSMLLICLTMLILHPLHIPGHWILLRLTQQSLPSLPVWIQITRQLSLSAVMMVLEAALLLSCAGWIAVPIHFA